jgi:hypothetical protein
MGGLTARVVKLIEDKNFYGSRATQPDNSLRALLIIDFVRSLKTSIFP